MVGNENCSHSWRTTVEGSYCIKCGKKTKKLPECKHEWEALKVGVKCKKCGKEMIDTGCCG